VTESVIAAQMFTLREFINTPEEVATTFEKVRALGYEAVQLTGRLMDPDFMEPRRLKEILDGEGLAVCATHVSYERLLNDPDGVIEDHRLYDCRYTAISSLPAAYRNAEGYSRFAREASEIGRRLAQEGIVLCYHNHAFELERFGDKTGLSTLYEESDPESLMSEIDTYWIQHGGGDSAQWLRDLKDRAPLVHLKDMTVRDNQQIMAEVGEGNLNWPSILKACEESGVLWYIVEQDICYRDPFKSLGISLKNLKQMGLK
jgi:sugar phosphate isomerase/epimerase